MRARRINHRPTSNGPRRVGLREYGRRGLSYTYFLSRSRYMWLLQTTRRISDVWKAQVQVEFKLDQPRHATDCLSFGSFRPVPPTSLKHLPRLTSINPTATSITSKLKRKLAPVFHLRYSHREPGTKLWH